MSTWSLVQKGSVRTGWAAFLVLATLMLALAAGTQTVTADDAAGAATATAGSETPTPVTDWLENAATTYKTDVADKLRADPSSSGFDTWLADTANYVIDTILRWLGWPWDGSDQTTASTDENGEDVAQGPVIAPATAPPPTTKDDAGATSAERQVTAGAEGSTALESELLMRRAKVQAELDRQRAENERRIKEGVEKLENFDALEAEKRRTETRPETLKETRDEASDADSDRKRGLEKVEEARRVAAARADAEARRLGYRAEMAKVEQDRQAAERKAAAERAAAAALAAERKARAEAVQKEMAGLRQIYITEMETAAEAQRVAEARASAEARAAQIAAQRQAYLEDVAAATAEAEARAQADEARRVEAAQATAERERLALAGAADRARKVQAEMETQRAAYMAEIATLTGATTIAAAGTAGESNAKSTLGQITDNVRSMAESGARNATVAIESALARLTNRGANNAEDGATTANDDAANAQGDAAEAKKADAAKSDAVTTIAKAQEGARATWTPEAGVVADSGANDTSGETASKDNDQSATMTVVGGKRDDGDSGDAAETSASSSATASTTDTDEDAERARMAAAAAAAASESRAETPKVKPRSYKKRHAKKKTYKRSAKHRKRRYSKKRSAKKKYASRKARSKKAYRAKRKKRKAPKYYRVRRGDTLSAISQRFYGTPKGAHKIYRKNRRRLESVHMIRVGQRIRLPRSIR